jgi:DNA-binding response OmpR family regulator
MILVKQSGFLTGRAALRVHLKRTVSFGHICVDLDGMEVRRDGRALPITVGEFRVLEFLLSHAGTAVSREQLLALFPRHKVHATRTIDNFIVHIRKKLEDNPRCPRYIRTIYRVGYSFDPRPSIPSTLNY